MRTKQESLKINKILKSGRKLSDDEFLNFHKAVINAFDQVLYDVNNSESSSVTGENEHFINIEIKELIPDKLFTNEEELSGPDIVIPYGYTHIASNVFSGRDDIVNVNLPDSIAFIQSHAFCDCINLASINIPDSVLEIDEAAFEGCTSLNEIKIPAGVISIDINVFAGCTALQNIFVDADNQSYIDVEGVLYNKDKTKLIRYPEGKPQPSYVVPVSVREIAHNAFLGCDFIKSLYFPAG